MTKVICPDCDGLGTCGRSPSGKLYACERCGGHEDSKGDGYIEVSHSIEVVQLQELTQARIKELEGLVREMGVILELISENVPESVMKDRSAIQLILNRPQVKEIMEKTP